MKTFTFDQVRSAVASGGVLSANLRPAGSKFELEFETRTGTIKLITSVTKEIRRFGNPAKAFELVRELGLEGGRYSVAQWHPEDREVERTSRPDRSEALKAAHEALSHTDWLKDKLTSSAADTRPRVSHKLVMNEAQSMINRKHKTNATKTSA